MAISWKAAINGLWATASRWNGGTVPGAGDDAVIDVDGKYRVTISDDEAASSLTLDAADATLVDSGALALGGLFDAKAGTFRLDASGEITGGTIRASGAAFEWNGGTLRDVTYQGMLDLSAGSSALHIAGGFSMTGAGGSGAGEIDLTGINAVLTVDGGQTLDNLTLNIGDAFVAYPVLAFDSLGGAAPVLTLGTKARLVVAGGGSIESVAGAADETIVNNGQIIASADIDGSFGHGFAVNVAHLVNNGKISVSNGDRLDLTGTAFVNAAGATLTVAGAARSAAEVRLSDWSNDGTITAGTGGVVRLYGSFDRAKLAGITSSGGAVQISGTLDNSGQVLETGAGAALPAIWVSDTIKGGTIVSIQSADQPTPYTWSDGILASGIQFYGGTLSGVTFHGTMDLSTAQQAATIANGITMAGADGTGRGTIDLTGFNSSLTLKGTQTLDNATIELGGTDYGGTLFFDPLNNGRSTFTLGPNLDIFQSGNVDVALRMTFSAPNVEQAIVNDGTIRSQGNHTVTLSAPNLVNNGTLLATANGSIKTERSVVRSFDNAAGGIITVSTDDPFGIPTAGLDVRAGGTWSNEGTITSHSLGATNSIALVSLGSGAASWSNSGTIALGKGTIASIDASGTALWTNTGTISLAADARLALGGRFTAPTFESIDNDGGTINIRGTLLNAGHTLTVGSGSDDPLVTLESGGTIEGGTVVSNGLGLQLGTNNGTGVLDGVTWQGKVDLSVANASVSVRNGFVVTGAGGVGRGLIDLTGGSSRLTLAGGETLDKATLNIGAASGAATIVLDSRGGTTPDLTLGPDFAIVQAGLEASIESADASARLVLEGSLTASFAGGDFTITSAGFTNNGGITVANGGRLALQSVHFTNYDGTVLTGGSYEVDAASTLELRKNIRIVTNEATIVLDGDGSAIQAFVNAAGREMTIDETLQTIGVDGSLEILGGRDWTSSRVMRNEGTVRLEGGTFDVGFLKNVGGFSGHGVIASDFINSGGEVRAEGGTLEIGGTLAGPGIVSIGDDATLLLDTVLNPGVTVDMSAADATFAAAIAANILGTVASFDAGDTIDLLNVHATAASLIAGNKLQVTDGGTTVATIRLSGDYAGHFFAVASDGHGGSNITVAPDAFSPAPLPLGATWER